MADKNFKARIVNKNGTSAEWEKATSFVPKKGELILYTDLNKIKIGDGVTKVNDLPFSDDDKVSKAGDTMTGDLRFNKQMTGIGVGGSIAFGADTSEGPSAPSITGIVSPDVTGLQFKAGQIFLGTDELYNAGLIDESAMALRVPILLKADSQDKGGVSAISDGVALSADNGARLKVETQAITVCDNAGGASRIKGVKTPIDDTDAANKKYVDDSIPTTQIKELSSAVAKAEPFFVEVTIVPDGNHTINKTFSEIKAAYDAGRICYLRTTNQGALAQLIGITGLDTSREAIFACVDPSNLELTTGAFIVAEEDNSVTLTIFKSQRIIETTGLLKGSGNGTITAAVAGTDYAAVDHTHDTYTATEIDTMWNAVTIN